MKEKLKQIDDNKEWLKVIPTAIFSSLISVLTSFILAYYTSKEPLGFFASFISLSSASIIIGVSKSFRSQIAFKIGFIISGIFNLLVSILLIILILELDGKF